MTETLEVETVVVGGGVIGAAAAWALARSGHETALLERYEPGHVLGASHAATRNFNPSYAEPEYLRLVARALRLWRELEQESGSVLLEQTGIVNRGPRPDADEFATQVTEAGFTLELLPPQEASRRWPGVRFEGPSSFIPEGGRLWAERSVRAFHEAAARLGAQLRHGTAVESIRVLADDRVQVDAAGLTVTSRHAIVALGAWTQELLGALIPLPRLTVTEEHPAHFALRDGDDGAGWPSFNHRQQPSSFEWPGPVYGLVTPGEGVKVGYHGVGPVVSTRQRAFHPEPQLVEALQAYVREWLPGADPETWTTQSCTYTNSDDADFILDRHGPLVIAAGFSGHGFKFAPAIGEHLARLVSGRTSTIPRFRLKR